MSIQWKLLVSDSPTKIFISMARMACLSIILQTRTLSYKHDPCHAHGSLWSGGLYLVRGQRWARAIRGTVHKNDTYENLSRLWSRPSSFWSRFAGWTIVQSSPPNMTGATKVGNEGGSIPSMSCIGSSPHIFVAAAQSYCRVLERCWAVAVDHWHRVHDLQQIPIKPKHEQTLLIIAAIFRMMANISLQNLATSSKSFPIFVKVL